MPKRFTPGERATIELDRYHVKTPEALDSRIHWSGGRGGPPSTHTRHNLLRKFCASQLLVFQVKDCSVLLDEKRSCLSPENVNQRIF